MKHKQTYGVAYYGQWPDFAMLKEMMVEDKLLREVLHLHHKNCNTTNHNNKCIQLMMVAYRMQAPREEIE